MDPTILLEDNAYNMVVRYFNILKVVFNAQKECPGHIFSRFKLSDEHLITISTNRSKHRQSLGTM